MARYLVTGAGGFIGSHLTIRLLQLGHDVLGIDNAWSANAFRAPTKRFSRLDGDILNYAALAEAVRSVDYVLHQAALVSVESSFADPLKTFANNALGTANLLEAARSSARLRRVVLASSSAVDFDDCDPRALTSPYALTKKMNETWGKLYISSPYKVPIVMLRYYNVFGPGQNASGSYAAVIPSFMKAALKGARPTIFGDGNQTRDFIYVDNVVNANIAASESKQAIGQTLSVASGQSWSINRLWSAIAIMAQSPESHPLYAPAKPGEILYSVADIRAALAALGDFRTVSLAEGLRTTLEFYRRKQTPLTKV